MTDYDFALDLMTPDPSTIKRNKKKINELLDKYGSGDAIRQNADLADSFDYDFIHGDELIDEVLRERAEAQNSPQLQNPLLQTNQAALAREARAVRKAYHHDEDDNNNTTQYADNEYASTKSDAVATTEEATNEKNDKQSPFDYDTFVNVTMRPMIQEHEGITDYPYLDTKDNITIAVGANIQNNPWTIQWYLRNDESGKLTKLDNNNPEHKKIILEELAKLDEYKGKNMKAEAFKSKTNLRMSAQDVNEEYQRRMGIAIGDVKAIIKDFNNEPENRNKIEDFEKMPLPLQKVLIDMAFNLGRAGFNWELTDQKVIVKGKTVIKKVGYPNFWKALAAHRLGKMIDEVSRNENLESFKKRNAKMKELLRTLEILKNNLK